MEWAAKNPGLLKLCFQVQNLLGKTTMIKKLLGGYSERVPTKNRVGFSFN